jgi:hypothetical protein
VGPAPPGCPEDDPRRVVAEAVGYVGNNRSRMGYPRYRKLGLPTSSAPVESTIKRLNRRLKGTEKFWSAGGGEALLTVRAAYLSEDGRVRRYWAQPRPRGRAVGAGRLRARRSATTGMHPDRPRPLTTTKDRPRRDRVGEMDTWPGGVENSTFL